MSYSPAVLPLAAKNSVLQPGQRVADRSGQWRENKDLQENGKEVREWPQFRVNNCFIFAEKPICTAGPLSVA